MNTIIPIEEYRELLCNRQRKVNLMIALSFAFSTITFTVAMYFLSIYNEINTSQLYVLLLPITILLTLTIVFFILAKKAHKKTSPHFSFEQFNTFQTEGMKVPMYRVISSGNTSSNIFILVEILDDQINIYDHYKKQLKPYFSFNRRDAQFQFSYKTKQDIDIISKKVIIKVMGKSVRIFGFKEVNQQLYRFLKQEGWHVTIK